MIEPASIKLGRLPRQFSPEIPHWSSLRQAAVRALQAYVDAGDVQRAVKALPAPPPGVFWDKFANRSFGMMLNNRYGCCVCSAAFHSRQIWTSVATPPEDTEPDKEVLAAYEAACGFIPSHPSTDQGCFEQAFLKWWMKEGLPLANGQRDKLFGFIEIDPRNLNDVKEAIWQCGLVFIGFNVPAYLMSGRSIPWTWGLNPSGDQSIIGGHAVVLPSYYRNGEFGLVSWGCYYKMTSGFFRTFVDECYALVDLSWVESTGKTPLGLSAAQLEAAMAALK